ncbi:MAG TPA: VTT domain-containing protein [Kofleriaceae bacterium]|jgi:membrane-associated protein
MDAILDFFRSLIHLIREPGELITWGGYPGLALIVFLETGALVFFLPGDSLLVMAGLYAAKGDLNLVLLNAIVIAAAWAGPLLSYWIGARMGPRLFNKPRSRFFRPEHLRAAQDFYEKHGGKAIIIARFMPLVRTFVPVIAGMAKMDYRRYLFFTVIGGAAWVLSMTFLGYFLGIRFPVLGKHIEKVIIAVVLLSLVPAIIAYLKSRRSSKLQE